MNKKTTVLERIRSRWLLFFVVSQALGIMAALMIGITIDAGFSGYLIGYLIGVLFSFGGTIGLS